MADGPHIPGPRHQTSHAGAALGGVLLAALIFLWFQRMAGNSPYILTSEYTRALAAGHSYLGIKPKPELLAQSDPYDPRLNRATRLLDAALFRGRYYIYYGLTPFVTVLVPWFWATGRQLAESEVITGYAIASTVLAAFLLWDLRRRYLPRASPGALTLAIVAGALCSGLLLLIRNPRIYELVIAAAWFHDGAALVCCHLAFHRPRRERFWLALAGLNAGLAVGARPSHLPIAIAVTGVVLLRSLRANARWRERLRMALVCSAPLAAVAAGLAWYNWLRFGNPLNFGYRYLLLDARNFGETYFSPRYALFNLWHYVAGVPRGSGWFPFFEWTGNGPLPVPAGYYSLAQVYGLLWIAPYILLGGGALLFRRRSLPAGLRTMAWLVLGVGGGNLALLVMIDGATYRYEADFLTFGGLAGGLGLLALAHGARDSWRCRVGAAVTGVVAVLSVAASFCAAFALYDIARQSNPEDFARAARVFNQPRLWWEELHHTGLPEFRVRTLLPQNRYGHEEPLLVTGLPGLQDFLYLFYVAPGYLQVGFEAIGRGGPTSALMQVDYSRPVEIELALGWDWPPPGAGAYGGLGAAAVEALRRLLIVKVNGRTAIEAFVDHHPVAGIYHWGSSPDDSAFGTTYSGSALQISRVPLASRISQLAAARPESYGPLAMAFQGPEGPPGQREPLVLMGYRNRWQVLGVTRVDADTVRFFAGSSTAGAEVVSAPVRLPAGTTHRMELTAGGLLPPVGCPLWGSTDAAAQQRQREQLKVVLDGATILDAVMRGPEVGPNAVVLGKNSAGLSNLAPVYSGRIADVRRRRSWSGQP
jgi:hypothetical protein